MIPNKYQVERHGFDQLTGFRFVPGDNGIDLGLLEYTLQSNKRIWVGVENKRSVWLLVRNVTPCWTCSVNFRAVRLLEITRRSLGQNRPENL